MKRLRKALWPWDREAEAGEEKEDRNFLFLSSSYVETEEDREVPRRGGATTVRSFWVLVCHCKDAVWRNRTDQLDVDGSGKQMDDGRGER